MKLSSQTKKSKKIIDGTQNSHIQTSVACGLNVTSSSFAGPPHLAFRPQIDTVFVDVDAPRHLSRVETAQPIRELLAFLAADEARTTALRAMAPHHDASQALAEAPRALRSGSPQLHQSSRASWLLCRKAHAERRHAAEAPGVQSAGRPGVFELRLRI
eukprot:m.87638 g.87638  ORF g.87638 m.87638 type:complete len:158 (+) comp50984_c0_seq3:512-985(+)